jgi:hypothetical protein
VVEVPRIFRQSTHKSGNVVGPKPLGKIPGTYFSYRPSRPQGHSAAQKDYVNEESQGPHREPNRLPSSLQRSVSTNCATAYPIQAKILAPCLQSPLHNVPLVRRVSSADVGICCSSWFCQWLIHEKLERISKEVVVAYRRLHTELCCRDCRTLQKICKGWLMIGPVLKHNSKALLLQESIS